MADEEHALQERAVEVEEFDPAANVGEPVITGYQAVARALVDLCVEKAPKETFTSRQLRSLEEFLLQQPPAANNNSATMYVNTTHKATWKTDAQALTSAEPSRHKSGGTVTYRNLKLRPPPAEFRDPAHPLYPQLEVLRGVTKAERRDIMWTGEQLETLVEEKSKKARGEPVEKKMRSFQWPATQRLWNPETREACVLVEAGFVNPKTLSVVFNGPYSVLICGERQQVPQEKYTFSFSDIHDPKFSKLVTFDAPLDTSFAPHIDIKPGLVHVQLMLDKPADAQDPIIDVVTQEVFVNMFTNPGKGRQTTLDAFRK